MVSKCANPSCGAPFKYYRGGRLYLIDVPPAADHEARGFETTSENNEYFWVCERCTEKCNIVVDREGHVQVVPKLANNAGRL